jgi:hypothetical protein
MQEFLTFIGAEHRKREINAFAPLFDLAVKQRIKRMFQIGEQLRDQSAPAKLRKAWVVIEPLPCGGNDLDWCGGKRLPQK